MIKTHGHKREESGTRGHSNAGIPTFLSLPWVVSHEMVVTIYAKASFKSCMLYPEPDRQHCASGAFDRFETMQRGIARDDVRLKRAAMFADVPDMKMMQGIDALV